MKKNLKGCVELIPTDTAEILVDVNQYELIEAAGMTPDLVHKKNAHMTAAWRFGERTHVRIKTAGKTFADYRYLTFAVFAVNGAGGSFSILFDCGTQGRDGYECTLPITRDGWNSYRLELPFLRAVGNFKGWEQVNAISMDCTVGGQSNRTDTVLYFDHFYGWPEYAPPLYASMPELKGAAVFSKSGGYALVDRKRIANAPDSLAVKPFEREGILWLPMAPVAAGIAHSSVVDTRALTLSFTYRRKKYVFSGTSDRITVNGEEERLGFYPAVVGGTLFFPAEYVKSFFHWRQCYVDPMGLVVLSNRKNILDPVRDSATVWQLIADTAFVRPAGEKILEDLHRNFPNPGRGRLFASFDELMQLRRLAKSDAALGEYVASLKEQYGVRSAAYTAAPISEGESKRALSTAAKALLGFAMLYRVTGDKAYAERTAAEAEALAALSDWRLESDALWGELSLCMAVAYDWCKHVWSEGRKALLERAMLRNVLRPVLEVYNGKGKMWQAGGVSCAMINAGVLALSLALCDVYPQTAYKLLDRVLRNLEPCFEGLAPDGGHAESVAAWEKSTRALGLSVAMLEKACGTDYGLGAAPGFAVTPYFPIYTETANGAWNYHNAPALSVDTSLQFWFARRTQDSVLAWMHRRELLSGRKSVHPFDILFYVPVDDSLSPALPLDAVYRKAGLAVMRSDWGDRAAMLGLHGGSNRTSGADLDAGGVILEMGGERFFAETGGDNALPPMLRRRAAGQNTWVVDPTDEPAPDQNLDANVALLEMRSIPERAYAVVDMTSVSDQLLRAKRGVMLTENRTVAVIQDELTMATPSDFVWSVWTRAEVAVSKSGRSATLTQNGKTLACKLCGVGSPARFVATAQEGSAWTRITVCVPQKEKLRMAVVCRLLADGEKATEKVYDIIPLSRWGE